MVSFSSHRGCTGPLSYGSMGQRPSVPQYNPSTPDRVDIDSIGRDKTRGGVKVFKPVCVVRVLTWDLGDGSIPDPSPPLQLPERCTYECVKPRTTCLRISDFLLAHEALHQHGDHHESRTELPPRIHR